MLNIVSMPYGYKKFYNELKSNNFRLLDVGCGSHSPSIAKRFFPKCEYHGIDYQNYYNDDKDIKVIDKYYEINLNKNYAQLGLLPDNYFDIIYMSHIIEHTFNGLEIVSILITKLKTAGKIYIEYPSVKSLSLPSMNGTLNFCDDETHVRVYNNIEIANLLLSKGMRIIKAGTRRDLIKILFIPIKIFYNLVKSGKIVGGIFWDICGFASYIYAQKK